MINSGMMGMPLHFGKMPTWLTETMGNMGSLIVESIIDNYGTSEVLTRMSDPNWFQALYLWSVQCIFRVSTVSSEHQ